MLQGGAVGDVSAPESEPACDVRVTVSRNKFQDLLVTSSRNDCTRTYAGAIIPERAVVTDVTSTTTGIREFLLPMS